jgi:Phosphoglucomutase/phosphomannomutase, C-terminal domain
VLRDEAMDGIKVFLDSPDCAGKLNAADTWLLLRASGTKPLLRVYCESCSVEVGYEILEAVQRFMLQGSEQPAANASAAIPASFKSASVHCSPELQDLGW